MSEIDSEKKRKVLDLLNRIDQLEREISKFEPRPTVRGCECK